MIRCMLLLILCLFPSTLLAAEPMQMVYYDNYFPRSFLKDGRIQGVLVDVIDEILNKRMGLEVAHSGYPWKRAQALVKNGDADAFVTVPTEERRTFTQISEEPVLVFEIHLVTTKNNPRLKDLQQVKTIADLQGIKLVDYLGNGWAKKQLQGLDVTWLPEMEMLFPFLLKGRADALLASSRTLYDQKRLGYADDFVVLPIYVSQVQFHLCIRKDSPYVDILPRFDKEIAKARQEGLLQTIEESYF